MPADKRFAVGRTLTPLKVLVVARSFPSRTQPWLVAQLEQILRHDGVVEIAADHGVATGYPDVVDRLSLLECTTYVPVRGAAALRAASRALVPFGRTGRAARRGLGVLFRRRAAWPHRARGWWRALLKAPLLAAGPDIVHAHSLFAAYDSLVVPRALGVPLVLTFHGLHPKGVRVLGEPRRLEVFAETAAVLVNTRFAAEQVQGLGCPTQKVSILPQGIPMDRFPFRPRPRPASGPVVLLTVGRLQPDKGIRFAIEAIRLLIERGHAVEYRIVGAGPERAALEQLARRLGVERAVRFLGAVDDRTLVAEYGAAHVFVLPSVHSAEGHHVETQGVVIQEAQASGNLVVATRVGGIPECVDDGRSAFLVPDADAAALAEKLSWIMDHPERWVEWQRLGRAWVDERFDINRIGDRLWRLYHDVVTAASAGSS